MEINGEPARGISHTRAIELIQAGGNKVVLLLRPGAGLAQDNSKHCAQTLHFAVSLQKQTSIEAIFQNVVFAVWKSHPCSYK